MAKAYYARVSTTEQRMARQLVDVGGMEVYEDRCSGGIPLFERPMGSELRADVVAERVDEVHVHSLDRLGRDLADCLSAISFFTEHQVALVMRKEGLRTLDDEGNESPTSKMMISILSAIYELEKSLISERVKQGCAEARRRGAYANRKTRGPETAEQFLSKPKNQKILRYLREGMRTEDIQKLLSCSPNTIAKIRKRAGLPRQRGRRPKITL